MNEEKRDTTAEVTVVKYQARRAYARAVVEPLKIASFFLPLLPVYWAIRSVAGRTTTVDISVVLTFTVAVTITLAGAGWKYWRRSREQSAELQRLRQRCGEYEKRLQDQDETDDDA